ncbi:hypothetical protein [Methanoculleus sp.]|uniref:hypothetical protein n=2 Tax=Methanoculleus sp. TaxID=90427 RepID=UPI0025F63B46|nr:hypothetical protein [Methanoculleus sp.]
MVCSLLVLPAAGETLPPGNVSPGESTVNDTVTPEVTETPTVTPTEEPTVTPTEELMVMPTGEPTKTLAKSLGVAPMQFSTMEAEPEILFNGTVTLPMGAFPQEAYNSGKSYAVMNPTPLGVLHAVAESEGWVYNVTDKKYSEKSIFLLDDVDSYLKDNGEWSCYVNDVLKDGFESESDGLNAVKLSDGDIVTFYYGNDENPDNATAIINATVDLDEDDWTLALIGARNVVLTRSDFEATLTGMPSHKATGPDHKSNTWEGMPLHYIIGAIDDGDYGKSSTAFNSDLAEAGYEIILTSIDGRPTTFNSSVGIDDGFILGNKVNGTVLDPDDERWPLRLVGSDVGSDLSAKGVVAIQIGVEAGSTPPPQKGGTTEIRVVKYASDGVTIENETTITYQQMMESFTVIGGDNGVRLRFQGPTLISNDLWNPAEDISIDPAKVDEVVRGTAIKDLCDLVGGVPEGGEVKLVAPDGFKATINYTNIYAPHERQGEAIVAWWAERQGYVPDYSDGMRLFYNTSDGIFGADDMRVCLAEAYWHYFTDSGIDYPSAAGVSNKNIATIEIYEAPREDWNLILTGAIDTTITRAFFESGKACAMAGHDATWTDGDDVWSGMPLWLLCGYVDDANSHDYGTNCFNDTLADAGYNVTVFDYGQDGIKGTGDDFSATFNSSFIKRNNNIIVADEIDGMPLPDDGKTWPLKLVGTALTSNMQKVGSIDEIVLTGLPVICDATISLEEGWNFVSVPKLLSTGKDSAAIFANVDREQHSIWQYDATLKDWKQVTEADQILPLEGYWIYSARSMKVPLHFDTDAIRTPPAKMLAQGWNAVGFSDTEPATTRDTLLSLGDAWTQVIGYNAGTQQYETSIIRGGSGSHNDTQEMLPMKGYWVYLRGESELAAIGA